MTTLSLNQIVYVIGPKWWRHGNVAAIAPTSVCVEFHDPDINRYVPAWFGWHEPDGSRHGRRLGDTTSEALRLSLVEPVGEGKAA